MMPKLADATVLSLGLTGSFWTRCDEATRPLILGITAGSASGVDHLDAAVALVRGTSETPVVCAGWRSFRIQASEVTLLPAQYSRTTGGRAEVDDDREHTLPDAADEPPYPVAQVTDVDVGAAYWSVPCPAEFVPRCIESISGPLLQGFDFIVHRSSLLFRTDPLLLFPGGHVTVSCARDTGRSLLSHLLGADTPGRELADVTNYRFLNHSRLSFFKAACAAAGVPVVSQAGDVEADVALHGGVVMRCADGHLVETRATVAPSILYAEKVPSDEIKLVDYTLPAISYFPIGLLLGGKWANVEIATGDIEGVVWEPVGPLQLNIPFVRRLPDDSIVNLFSTEDGDTLNGLWAQSLVDAGWADLHEFLFGETLTEAGHGAQDPVTLDVVAGLVNKGILGRLILISTSYAGPDVRSRRLKSYVDRERPVGLPSTVINV